MRDYDYDNRFEYIVEMRDLLGNGVYDAYKYGYQDQHGEILYTTAVQHIAYETQDPYTSIDKRGTDRFDFNLESKWKALGDWAWDIFNGYHIRGEITKKMIAHTVKTDSKDTLIIQEDVNHDGTMDAEFSYAMSMKTTRTEYTDIEKTEIIWKPSVISLLIAPWRFLFGNDEDPDFSTKKDTITITKTYTDVSTQKSASIMFREFNETSTTYIARYEDYFPEGLSEKTRLDRYLTEVTNDQQDDIPSNDITALAPVLDEVLNIKHDENNVPLSFEYELISDQGELTFENLLMENVSLNFPGHFDSLTGLEQIEMEGITFVPEEGVVFDKTLSYGAHTDRMKTRQISDFGYVYAYIDGNFDGMCETIVSIDQEGNILGVGMDIDADGFLRPDRAVPATIDRENDYNFDTWWGFFSTRDLVATHGFLGHVREPEVLTLFSDPYFQISDITMEGKTSELIQATSEYMSGKFYEEMGWDKLWEDVAWEVAAGVAGYVGSYVATPLVGAISYAAVKVPQVLMDVAAMENVKTRMTFYQYDNNGNLIKPRSKVLSEKLWVDSWFGGLMTNSYTGSMQGIYAPIYKVVDDLKYEAQVILAPQGTFKKEFQVEEVIESSLSYQTQAVPEFFNPTAYLDYDSYALTTRNFLYYSEFDKIDPDIKTDARGLPIPLDDQRIRYLPNSIPFLEDAIYSITHGDFDRIVMMENRGHPYLDFSSSETSLLPDFYEDYPLIVSQETYEKHLRKESMAELVTGTLPRESYYPIYKVYKYESEAQMQLIPESSTHQIKNAIPLIEVYNPNDVEIKLGQYDLLGFIDPLSTLEEGKDYMFDSKTGTLHLSKGARQELDELIEDQWGIEELVLKACVYKYHNMEDLTLATGDRLTPSQMARIAFMQGLQADLMDYFYQYQIATETTQQMAELRYTMLVTAISVPITVVLSMAIGAMLKSTKVVVLPTVENSLISVMAGETAAVGAKTAASTIATQSISRSLASLFATAVVRMAVTTATEVLQEVWVDPLLEATVEGIIDEFGGGVYAQAIGATLAESGREVTTGVGSHNTQLEFSRYLQEQNYDPIQDPEGSQIARLHEQFRSKKTRRTLLHNIGKAITTLTTVGTALTATIATGGIGLLGMGTYYACDHIQQQVDETITANLIRRQLRQAHEDLHKAAAALPEVSIPDLGNERITLSIKTPLSPRIQQIVLDKLSARKIKDALGYHESVELYMRQKGKEIKLSELDPKAALFVMAIALAGAPKESLDPWLIDEKQLIEAQLEAYDAVKEQIMTDLTSVLGLSRGERIRSLTKAASALFWPEQRLKSWRLNNLKGFKLASVFRIEAALMHQGALSSQLSAEELIRAISAVRQGKNRAGDNLRSRLKQLFALTRVRKMRGQTRAEEGVAGLRRQARWDQLMDIFREVLLKNEKVQAYLKASGEDLEGKLQQASWVIFGKARTLKHWRAQYAAVKPSRGPLTRDRVTKLQWMFAKSRADDSWQKMVAQEFGEQGAPSTLWALLGGQERAELKAGISLLEQEAEPSPWDTFQPGKFSDPCDPGVTSATIRTEIVMGLRFLLADFFGLQKFPGIVAESDIERMLQSQLARTEDTAVYTSGTLLKWIAELRALKLSKFVALLQGREGYREGSVSKMYRDLGLDWRDDRSLRHGERVITKAAFRKLTKRMEEYLIATLAANPFGKGNFYTTPAELQFMVELFSIGYAKWTALDADKREQFG
ncbi:MAG: hypothetical protein GF353_26175, partial [Candidatus Lokiarchaeota archaeon]|nr:hypothetical protein [Candidatus Lokiarchaeota archaeon]